MKLIQTFADTNTGRKRRHNEDSFVCQPPLFAVADGMGGAQAGEVASALAADTLRYGKTDFDADGPSKHIVDLIQTANQRVYQRAHDDVAAQGMGTTMTAALFQEGGVIVIGHVGDSRAYVLRDGTLEQLTDDHSLVAELVRRGELSPEEAELHPQRSVITRALGTDPDVDVDTFTFQSEAGDIFLLCSDGLTSMVDVATITRIIQSNRARLDAASRALIKAANDRGGEDNITTVLFSVGAEQDDPTVALPSTPAPVDSDEEDTLHPEDNVPVIAEPPPADRTMVMSPEQIQAALRGESAPAPDAPAIPPPEAEPTWPTPPQEVTAASQPGPDETPAVAELEAAEPEAAQPDDAQPEEAQPEETQPSSREAPTVETPTLEPEARDTATLDTPTVETPTLAAEDAGAPADEAPPQPLAFLEDTQPRPPVFRRLLAVVVIVVLAGLIVLLLVKGLTR